MVSTNNDNPTGMPSQVRSNFVAGTNSPFTSAAKAGALNAENQNNLINGSKTGGKRRRRRRYNGGASNVAANAASTNSNSLTVPPVQAGAVNSSQTAGQYADLTRLSAGAMANSQYDSAATKGVTKGGSRKRRSRRRSRRRRNKMSRRNKK
jgi:hypothetical protein